MYMHFEEAGNNTVEGLEWADGEKAKKRIQCGNAAAGCLPG
jgi:hypothetical protein